MKLLSRVYDNFGHLDVSQVADVIAGAVDPSFSSKSKIREAILSHGRNNAAYMMAAGLRALKAPRKAVIEKIHATLDLIEEEG